MPPRESGGLSFGFRVETALPSKFGRISAAKSVLP